MNEPITLTIEAMVGGKSVRLRSYLGEYLLTIGSDYAEPRNDRERMASISAVFLARALETTELLGAQRGEPAYERFLEKTSQAEQ